MSAKAKDFEQLMARYNDFLGDFLDDDEKLVNAGAAVSVLLAEQHGRGEGEGILGLTSRNLTFRVESGVLALQGMKFPLEDITRMWSKNIIIPKMRELFVGLRDTGMRPSFYAGKGFVKQLEGQINR